MVENQKLACLFRIQMGAPLVVSEQNNKKVKE